MTLNIAGVSNVSGPGANLQNKPQTKKLGGGGLKKLAPPPGFKGKKKTNEGDLLGTDTSNQQNTNQ